MLQLKNTTPYAAAMALFPNEQGVDTLYTMVKASFKIGRQWTLLDEQTEPYKEDVYWAEPPNSSLRFASDFHPGKAATDVIIAGCACAPDATPVPQMDVSVQLGDIHKTLRVFGDRYWEQGRKTAPQAFVKIPLVYERAFGGTHAVNGEVAAIEARNPVGLGFAGERAPDELNGFPLPNLECPQQLITDVRDTPAPACLAAIAPYWQPRTAYAGTYDQLWQQERAPYLPDDYSPRFMNCAHPDLICRGFLQGGEAVHIRGMHPGGDFVFKLPQVQLRHSAFLAGKEHLMPFKLETVFIDTEQLQLSLTWRAALVCNHAHQVGQVSVSMRG